MLPVVLLASGCVRESYQFGLGPRLSTDTSLSGAPAPNPLSAGGEHPRIDKIETVVQWPRKAARKLFRREELNTAEIEAERAEAIQVAQQYLQVNELNDVAIDVRRYEPAEQWQRIQENNRIAPFWKATGGTLSFLSYALIPRRALHSNHYDPFSNTLSLNSTRSTSAIYEAAMAKQFRRHPMLGTYAMLQYVPVVPLAHHSYVSSDVLTYTMVTEQTELQHELYPAVYARLGGAAVSETLSLTPLAAGKPFYTAPLMRVTGTLAGAATGHAIAKQAADD